MNKIILWILIGLGIIIVLPILIMIVFATLNGLGITEVSISNIPLGPISYFMSSPSTMIVLNDSDNYRIESLENETQHYAGEIK